MFRDRFLNNGDLHTDFFVNNTDSRPYQYFGSTHPYHIWMYDMDFSMTKLYSLFGKHF